MLTLTNKSDNLRVQPTVYSHIKFILYINWHWRISILSRNSHNVLIAQDVWHGEIPKWSLIVLFSSCHRRESFKANIVENHKLKMQYYHWQKVKLNTSHLEILRFNYPFFWIQHLILVPGCHGYVTQYVTCFLSTSQKHHSHLAQSLHLQASLWIINAQLYLSGQTLSCFRSALLY